MRASLSVKLFGVVLVGALVTGAAAIFGLCASSPWVAWPVASALSLATAAAAFAVSRALLTDACGRMIASAKRLGGGDLNATVTQALPAELTGLGHAFNAMAAELKSTLGFAEGALTCLSESFPFLTLDNDGLISHISPMLATLLDFSGDRAGLIGKTPGEFFYREPGRSTTSLEALKQNKKIERDTTLTTLKGNKRVVKVSANPVHDSDGKLVGSLTIYFDLTQIKEHEQALADHANTIENLVRDSLAISAEVNDASESLAVLITDANSDAKRLLEFAGESATAMEQMNATVMEVARNSTGAASMAKDASHKAT
ncbi:MAG: PAS domain-containing protein, partial [Desulfovibrionaceae bacterium]|nr:PAS domain-containing protein [Desulfovibrionaceae bacterium]